jgi:uncharacterized protein DUF6516
MRIEEYFRRVDATITLCSRVVLKTMLYDERFETKGFMRGLLHFDDDSELHIREFVDVSTSIERYKYSYHYMRAGRLMFRYDNSADITTRDFATYPQHKYVGDTIQAASPPRWQQCEWQLWRCFHRGTRVEQAQSET